MVAAVGLYNHFDFPVCFKIPGGEQFPVFRVIDSFIGDACYQEHGYAFLREERRAVKRAVAKRSGRFVG
jgi:hypothetical protein